jgi:hypothetical protein
MWIGAGLLALGSLAFFLLGAVAVTSGADGPMSQLFAHMGTVGGGLFLALAVVYATLAIYLLRLVWWARFAVMAFIAVGMIFAIVGIVVSLPRPDIMVFVWQLFVIAVDVWILWYLMRPHVKDAFAAKQYRTGTRVEV